MRIGLSLKLPEPKYNVLAQNVQALFADGSQGWWYDNQDLTTLFQDSAGTTLVTAVEQSVGLQLDKSKGLVLGPELSAYASGFFSLAGISGIGATVALSGSSLLITSTSTDGSDRGEIPISGLTIGTRYVVTIVARRGSQANNQTIRASTALDLTSAQITSTSPTSFVWRTQAIAASGVIRVYCADAPGAIGDNCFVDSISVRELPGNHRYQTTSGSRPVWSKRVNLLTKTEQFDDAAWTKGNVTVTANATTAPDGTATADTLDEGTANNYHNLTGATFAAGTYTLSVYAKNINAQYVILTLTNSSGTYCSAVYDIATGVVANSAALGPGYSISSTGISNVGGGWYRCLMTCVVAGASAFNIGMSDSTSIGNFGLRTYTGTSRQLYIWGADLRPANQATGLLPLYQRVNTATDYETTGFPGYLKADGTDDFLQTNSIDFTATDKVTLCAGVRKLSDAARGMVAEIGNDVTQSFQFNAPASAAPQYSFASRGSAAASSAVYNNAAVAAPVTNVATGIGDISGDSAILRINGTQVASSTSDQGTGNYGNLPAYFFRRGGTTLPFNGEEYANICVGKLLTADQLTALETYVNGATKAFAT